jgi:hypothetical protein
MRVLRKVRESARMGSMPSSVLRISTLVWGIPRGGETIGVFFGEDFGEVIVGHGAISTVFTRISVLIIFCLVGVFDALSETLGERLWYQWSVWGLLG